MSINCYADPFPTFQPAMRLITAITQANPAQVTTSFAHQYVSGTIVRFDIPPADGMQQLNQQTATITVNGTTTFTIPIDTTNYTAFAIPVSPPSTTQVCALVVPIGESSAILAAAVRNVLPY